MNEDRKFYLSLIGLTITFLCLSAYIKNVFPLPEQDLTGLLGTGYIWYSMLVVLNLFILSLIPFLIGMRFQIYKINKELDVIR